MCMPTPPTALLLGLTGGIGSGKSTVASLLAQLGASVIDADALARAATAPGGAAIAAIAQTFGPSLLDANGALDRQAMRALIYADPGARQRLEAIIHPIVMRQSDSLCQVARQAGCPLIVFDLPLLAEAGARWRSKVDRVLVIDCDRATQIRRVMARNQWPRGQIESVLAAQASRSQRLATADAVIYNGAGISQHALRTQVERWAAAFGLMMRAFQGKPPLA